MTLATCRVDSLNNIERWLDAVRSYAGISFTSEASSFSRARTRRTRIWLAGNLRDGGRAQEYVLQPLSYQILASFHELLETIEVEQILVFRDQVALLEPSVPGIDPWSEVLVLFPLVFLRKKKLEVPDTVAQILVASLALTVQT